MSANDSSRQQQLAFNEAMVLASCENLSKDAQLKQMLEEGWPWLVVSWAVEEEWPDLRNRA